MPLTDSLVVAQGKIKNGLVSWNNTRLVGSMLQRVNSSPEPDYYRDHDAQDPVRRKHKPTKNKAITRWSKRHGTQGHSKCRRVRVTQQMRELYG